MKVLLINSVCGIGSTGRICTDLALALESQGHEAKIAYGRNGNSPNYDEQKTIRIGTSFDVRVHGVETRLFDKHGFGSLKATNNFLKEIDKYSPDIIHMHNLHGYYINVESLFKYIKEKQIPVVWTLHDCWAFTGHCTHFDRVSCEKWKSGCYKCEQKSLYPTSILDCSKSNYVRKKKAFCGVDNMILTTPSKWMKSFIEMSFLRNYAVKIVPNGIDTTVFKKVKSNIRRAFNISEKYIVLGVSSGWPETKRLAHFVRLSHDLGDDYKVVVIGISEEQRKELPKNMIGLLKTTNVQELVGWYSEASVFLNPTVEDNYPTVNLEAQACGTPVITYRTGGSPETITPGYGIILEKDDYNGLVDATIRLCKEGKPNISSNIKDRIECANDYIKIYEEILS